jgi:peptidoglycan-N-acetylglucosamine deacetylase
MYRNFNIFFLALILVVVGIDTMFVSLSWIPVTVVVVAYLVIVTYGVFMLDWQFFLPVLSTGKKSSNTIAITFDDGPRPGGTEKILDILKTYNTEAAFFCIGNHVAQHPELAKRINQEGHLIGNHSYWHGTTFDLQSAERMDKELRETNKVISEAVGVTPGFFRPPYGITNPMLAKAVKMGGYKTIGWSVRSFDTVIRDHEVWMNRVTKSLKGGDVILFHDHSEATQTMLPAFLDHVSKIGLKIVRVDVLLNEKGYV